MDQEEMYEEICNKVWFILNSRLRRERKREAILIATEWKRFGMPTEEENAECEEISNNIHFILNSPMSKEGKQKAILKITGWK